MGTVLKEKSSKLFSLEDLSLKALMEQLHTAAAGRFI